MAIPNIKKIRLGVLGASFVFTFTTLALLAYMTFERQSYTSTHPTFTSDPCSITGTTGLKVTATYGDDYLVIVCPWGAWDLLIGYISVIVALGFLGSLVIRHWRFSLKMLRLTLLLGLVGSVLLILAFITLVNTIQSELSLGDYTWNGVTASTSKFESNSNAAMMFLSFFTVLALFIFELWSYKETAQGFTAASTIRGALL